MKAISFLFGALLLVFGLNLNAQNILNAVKVTELRDSITSRDEQVQEDEKPLPYGYIDDRDVFWSKKVWEVFDMNEKINMPYYFPVEEYDGISGRKSLYNALMKGIMDGEITEVYDDDHFQVKLDAGTVKSRLANIDTVDAGFEIINLDGKKADISEYVNINTVKSEKIKYFKIMGMWYIDKKLGEMRYRLLGICPMGPDAAQMKYGVEEYVPLFWVFYPDARKVLHRYKVFNDKNASVEVSLDDMLNARRWNSFIYKEENSYGDRPIAGDRGYIKDDAKAILKEGKRIHESVRGVESDMWNH